MTDVVAMGDNATEELNRLLERVEALTEDKKDIQSDISEVKKEAKAAGFDMKAFNEMLKLRKMSAEDRVEHEEMRAFYASKLGLSPTEEAGLA